jgi:hypothetical protein
MTPRFIHVLMVTLIFFIVSNPMVYKLTDKLVGSLTGPLAYGSGCPTTLGLLVHSAVFAGAIWSLH